MCRKDLNAFDFTESSKVRSQVFNAVLSREVLNKEVALLFRILKSLLLSQYDSLSLKKSQSWLNIEFNTIEFSIIELSNCTISRSEASIWICRILEADESKLAVRILGISHNGNRLNFSVIAEDLLDLFLVPSWVKVFNVDVV
jgi:hypothetical protein